MNVFENDVRSIYILNDLTWEQVNELPYFESLRTLEDGIVKEYHSLYGGNYQEERSDSNNSQNVGQIDAK